MASSTRTPSPAPPPSPPQNTPFTSRPTTSHGTPTTRPNTTLSHPLYTLPSLVNTLLPKTRLAHAPQTTQSPTLTPAISNLNLHPTLEAALHILNADLHSAHFLVRHMNGPPAVEGMLLHSILHRIEGDFSNARAWFGDVRDVGEGWVPKKKGLERLDGGVCERVGLEGEGRGVLEFVYGGQGWEGEDLIAEVERLRGMGEGKGGGDTEEVEEKTRAELERVIEWCRRKFGEERWVDASEAWVRPGEEIRSIGNDMVSGDKGWRKF